MAEEAVEGSSGRRGKGSSHSNRSSFSYSSIRICGSNSARYTLSSGSKPSTDQVWSHSLLDSAYSVLGNPCPNVIHGQDIKPSPHMCERIILLLEVTIPLASSTAYSCTYTFWQEYINKKCVQGVSTLTFWDAFDCVFCNCVGGWFSGQFLLIHWDCLSQTSPMPMFELLVQLSGESGCLSLGVAAACRLSRFESWRKHHSREQW